MIIGLALILSSVTLVTGRRLPRFRDEGPEAREQEQGQILTTDR
jgi:hypothetical protein